MNISQSVLICLALGIELADESFNPLHTFHVRLKSRILGAEYDLRSTQDARTLYHSWERRNEKL